jgi:hypothetical protein
MRRVDDLQRTNRDLLPSCNTGSDANVGEPLLNAPTFGVPVPITPTKETE